MDKNTTIVLITMFVALAISQIAGDFARAWGQRGGNRRHKQVDD